MYDDPCETRQELSNVVGKVYNLCRVKTIRVAVVHGYGQLVRPHLMWMRNSTPILCFNEDEVVGIVEKVQDLIIPNIYLLGKD